MKTQQEKLLVATLAGLIIMSAAAFLVTPGKAREYEVGRMAEVTNLAWWEQLDLRRWPVWLSAKTGSVRSGDKVRVEWCLTVEHAADWCRIVDGEVAGWVNSKYLTTAETAAN